MRPSGPTGPSRPSRLSGPTPLSHCGLRLVVQKVPAVLRVHTALADFVKNVPYLAWEHHYPYMLIGSHE
jgi:hypothetical protein